MRGTMGLAGRGRHARRLHHSDGEHTVRDLIVEEATEVLVRRSSGRGRRDRVGEERDCVVTAANLVAVTCGKMGLSDVVQSGFFLLPPHLYRASHSAKCVRWPVDCRTNTRDRTRPRRRCSLHCCSCLRRTRGCWWSSCTAESPRPATLRDRCSSLGMSIPPGEVLRSV